MDTPDRPDVFLFSAPRTLSSLLEKLVDDQPGWNYGAYYFHDAFKYLKFTLGKTSLDEASPEQRTEYNDLLQQGFVKFLADREAAKAKGEPLFVKNHAFQVTWPTRFWNSRSDEEGDSFCISPSLATKTNPTFLPDEILIDVIPVFTIRHPALVAESWYRTESRASQVDFSAQSWRTLTGYEITRDIHDWFLKRCPERAQTSKGPGPFHPLIIDADEIVEDEKAVAELCRLCNMDSTLVPSQWETKELPASAWGRSYCQGLWTSTAIDKSKSAKGLDLQERYGKWRDEFGFEVAEFLIAFTEREMQSYLYLKERRIQ